MTVYLSAHYNLSRFTGSITNDHIERYRQVVEWFTSEPNFKGTISLNSLFLQSVIWENTSIIKDISKLCLTDQIELSSSMYSNFVPFEEDKEENAIAFQVQEAIRILKDIYPENYIKGFYPPFSVCDNRMFKYLVDEEITYIILDWYILDKALSRTPIGSIDPKFSKPFKIKDRDLYVLPSFNLHSVYRMFPELYSEYLKSGALDSLLETIQEGAIISEKQGIDLYGILTFDFNDLKFPRFRSDFDIDNYFNESKQLSKAKCVFIKPSEIIDVFDIEEVELKYSLPYELAISSESGVSKDSSTCCQELQKNFEEASRNIALLKSSLEKIDGTSKIKINNLLKYSKYFLATAQHNICFSSLSEPIKGIDFLKAVEIWRSINHLNLVNIATNVILDSSTEDSSSNSLQASIECGELVYTNRDYLCSFQHRGGVISNLINLQNGEFVVSTPSHELAINQTTLEPRYGLMYDIISKKYSGQYNLFNEGYVLSERTIKKGVEICLSVYASNDVILKKYYSINYNSNEIKVRYKFENRGVQKEEFSLYSLSKFNLGDYVVPVFSKEDLLFSSSTEDNKNQKIILTNKQTSSKVIIKLPNSISYNLTKNFRDFDLTLKLTIPVLAFNDTKEFEFSIFLK